jgi:predicted acylesterase/phospholipase RssA
MRPLHIIRFATILAALTLLGAPACTAPRRSITAADLDARVAEHTANALAQRDRLAIRFLHRIERVHQANVAAGRHEPAEINVLLLSSGGQYGAFGTGVLNGWSHSEDSGYRRPTFDVVTGVSTGALIAPFAISGEDDSIRLVARLFKEADESFARLRGILFFLPWRTSIFDTRVLWERVQSEVNADIVASVAAAHAEDRLTLVGAVDLDLGRFHIWDMGPIAEEAVRTSDLSAFHSALISSASIPGAFPPIEIDGVLYTDGAAALATFLGLDRELIRQVVDSFLARNPGAHVPRLRMWMIVNHHIDPESRLAEQGWTSVTLRSAEVIGSYSLRSTLRLMQLGSELIGNDIGMPVEFRYIAVPDNVDLPPPENKLFDRDLMFNLFHLGYELGKNSDSWHTEAIAPDIPGSTIQPQQILFDSPD